MRPLRSSIKLHLWVVNLVLALYIATHLTLDLVDLDITCAQAHALSYFSMAIPVLGLSLSAHQLVIGGVYAEQPNEPPPLEEGGLSRQKSDPALALQSNEPSPDEEDVRRDPALALSDFLFTWIFCAWAFEAFRALLNLVDDAQQVQRRGDVRYPWGQKVSAVLHDAPAGRRSKVQSPPEPDPTSKL
ncbi:hypothetical protein KC343_g10823 [Hortaea werneckii]|nr:hypothetical protein KC352_g20064 [Hortaea werneckii]KAI7558453.1 hypothetical protein KC317_g10996 [Hortaea werneckii]KAI7606060.1 hypothetical protein KC346_g10725 [Hortaea werneckii]KAI7613575.1 hypothetical protein KC343_g10823 [Hortaea werneckii]KAI7653093.1 hypothetical protein KC319_g10591 [Hortaea werneckii]